ncbi:MAG TPA: ferric reductase-like transmembrane domain-containing protein [Xanthobacteraceae bacterium]|nr:ferric reductase-like transmembrane domain-containing protein [Xanthobacteraceae bacterium]
MTLVPSFLTERSGRLSPEKTVAFIGALLPALWLLGRALSGTLAPPAPFGGAPGLGGEAALGARPLMEAIRFLGDWTVRLLLVTLAITPARRLFNLPKLIAARRILGLATLGYGLLHLGLFVIDQGSLITAVREIVLRIYLLIGFVALAAMLALGLTSWDGAVRRLGAERWNRLHRLIYPVAVLAIVHFFLQQKLDVTQPTLMAGLLAWLFGWRAVQARGLGTRPLALAALALAAGLATALIEAAWYALATGIDPALVLQANLAFDYSVRPAWWVLAAGLSVAAASLLALRLRPLPARTRAA